MDVVLLALAAVILMLGMAATISIIYWVTSPRAPKEKPKRRK